MGRDSEQTTSKRRPPAMACHNASLTAVLFE
jgi:hypothetical protein